MTSFQRSFAIVILLALPASVVAVEDQAVDDAIVNALRFLAQQQRPNGSWNAENPGGESTATTSLAVMAFLAAGHVPSEGPYGQAIDRGVTYVLERQQNNGLVVDKTGHGPMYDHGISTLMLSEVVGMMPKEQAARTRKVLEKAVSVIMKAQQVRKSQRESGGWRYQLNSQDSDLSVTAWQLLALRAVKDVGCDVPAESIELAVGYVKKCSNGRGFAYQPGNGPTSTLTSAGILALQVCDHHEDAEVANGIDFLQRQPMRFDDQWFFYGAYYNAISVYKYGGGDWERTKSHLFQELLSNQQPLGGWQARNPNERGHGAIYATSLGVLALTVEYGYLPIYQR